MGVRLPPRPPGDARIAGDPQAADEWRAAYDRVGDLARQAGDDGMAVTVPATPDWAARDLLAHMIGVGVDAVAGTTPQDLNPRWTQGHVDARADHPVVDLLGDWQQHADEIEIFVREQDASPLGDVIIHEQDLRGALGEPGARDTAGLAMVRSQLAGPFGDAIADGLPPLVLHATDDDWSWSSAAAGTAGEPGAVLRAPLFDLTRAILSRRTADQLRQWTSEGDVDLYLDAFAHLGPLPEHPLPE